MASKAGASREVRGAVGGTVFGAIGLSDGADEVRQQCALHWAASAGGQHENEAPRTSALPPVGIAPAHCAAKSKALKSMTQKVFIGIGGK